MGLNPSPTSGYPGTTLLLDESLVLYEPEFPNLYNGNNSSVSWPRGAVRKS